MSADPKCSLAQFRLDVRRDGRSALDVARRGAGPGV